MSPTAGYSGTPLVRKLGIRPGARLGLIGAPEGIDETLGELPAGVVVRRRAQGSFDVIVGFCTGGRRCSAGAGLARALEQDGGLWIAWPKRSSGRPPTSATVWCASWDSPSGLVDNKVCAIDETWSGLRFVYRLVDRTVSRRRTYTRAQPNC